MVGSQGWRKFSHDPRVLLWSVEANLSATKVLSDPDMDQWYRHQRTWFVGVDALPNLRDGSVNGVPLEGPWDVAGPWHPAQLSVVYQGYPRRDEGESAAAHKFRIDRCAAHLDGLLAEGPDKRRYLREPHAFVLGIALNDVPDGASPLVVWEGSQDIIRSAFTEVYQGIEPRHWRDLDVTQTYQAARREVFERCTPVEVPLQPGEAVLVHRLAIHGVAPWRAGPGDRRIAYFRPLMPDVAGWLTAD